MEQVIRPLKLEDYPYLKAMETGIEDDYVVRIFERLVAGQNHLYGLFIGEHLASVCGYTLFGKSHAMIGRIRSDVRYRGKDLATQLTKYVLNVAKNDETIRWVGANTQEENLPARRVLEKLGLTVYSADYGATAQDLSMLENNNGIWTEIKELSLKKSWVERLYIETGAVFPYECYYPFPATRDLFTDEELAQWGFYENEESTRILITKKDFKKHDFLQAIYPWDDIMEQPGLWETISADYRKLAEEAEGECFVWMDLTKQAAHSLPKNHSFTLSSPWMLYGIPAKKESLL